MSGIRNQLRSLSQKKVVRNFLAVLTSNLAMKPVQILREYYVTKYLGPADYGILKSLELIQMLDKFGSLGFRSVAIREVGHHTGGKNPEKIRELKDMSFTAEFLLTVLIFIIALVLAFLVFSGPLTYMVILVAFGIFFSKLRAICNTEFVINKEFGIVSKTLIIATLVGNILVILLVPHYRLYAVLGLNSFTSLTALFIYLRKLGFRFFQFRFEKSKFKKILKTGVSLSMNTLSQGLYKYLERILVLALLGKILLGFYGFSYMVCNQVILLFKALIKVRVQDIHINLGGKKYKVVHRLVMRETLISLGFAIVLAAGVYFVIAMIIRELLPNWVGAIPYVRAFLIMVPIQILPNFFHVVLSSTLINKQKLITAQWLVASAGLAGFTLLLHSLDELSLMTFIWINIISYGYFSISGFVYYRKHFYLTYVIQND